MSLSLEHRDARDFTAFLRLKNLSPRTIAQYEWVLKDFFRCCPPELSSPEQIDFDHLRVYIATCQARGIAPKTVADRVMIFKRFFGFLLLEGRIPCDPSQRLPMPKVGKRLPKALTIEETEAFFAALPKDWKTSAPAGSREALAARVKQRDRVLFEIMYAGGLRVSEAVGLSLGDIDFGEGSLRVLGKGNQERRIYFKPRVMLLLEEYVETQQLSHLLFSGRNNKPLSTRYVESLIKLYAQAAGIVRTVTPHTLRHSIAVHYLQGGAPVSFVQGLLGHSSLATTGKYLLLTDQMAKQVALETKTALDRLTDTAKVRRFHERHGAYQYQRGEWDAYTSQVLEWLAG